MRDPGVERDGGPVAALVARLRARLGATAAASLWTRPFLLVCGTHLLAYGSYAAVNPTFAAYLGTVTDSEALVGLAFGAFTFAAVATRPLAGWLLDRLDRRVVQAVAAVGFAGVTLSFAVVKAVWAILALRVAYGVAWGVSSTATPTLAADVVPPARRSDGLSYFGVLPNVALVVLPPVGLAVAHRAGFGAQFAGAALLAVLAVGPLVALGETEPSASRPGPLVARDALPAATLVALATVPLGAIDALVPLYARAVGLANAGLFFTVMGGAIVVVRAAAGRLPGSTTAQLSVSFLVQASGLVTLAFGPGTAVADGVPLGILAAAALFGVGFALVFPLLQSVAVARTRSDRTGSATATVLVGMDLGIGVGAMLFGVVADVATFTVVYAAAAAFPLCGALATVLVRPDAASEQ